MSTTLESWNKLWTAAKAARGDCEIVLKAWKEPPPVMMIARSKWDIPAGFRKNTERVKGEQQLEQQILGKEGEWKEHSIDFPGAPGTKFAGAFNNFALMTQRSGQKIADGLGFICSPTCLHPVCIEVKTTANSLWSAVVQNLQQVRAARANRKNIENFVNNLKESVHYAPHRNSRGTWGMVVAPSKYYEKYRGQMPSVLDLLEQMKKKTTARVILCSMDKEVKILRFRGGYIPTDLPRMRGEVKEKW